MLENDLYKLLSTDPGVLTAMGNSNNVFLGMIPKGFTATPALVVQTAYTTNFTAADGPINNTMRRVQFDSYATKYTDAITLSKTVRDLLRSYKGALSSTFINGVIVRQDMDFPVEPGTSGYVFRRMLEIDFWFTDLN